MIAGIDYSSHAVDIALLEDDSIQAKWVRIDLEGGTPFERARSLRNSFPSPSWWEHYGVYLVGIEDPHSRANHTAKALGLVAGAIATRLPPRLTVVQTVPVEWKRLTVGKPSATKDEVARWARTYLDHGGVQKWPQDAYDAYAIARAVRVLNDGAIAAGAA